MTEQECITHLLEKSHPVINLYELRDDIWYRNTKGSRHGPWLSAQYEVLDRSRWTAKDACLYFVSTDRGDLKYVGISNNTLEHRWRTSPAYDQNGSPLHRKELFHSQCWPSICEEYARYGTDRYAVSVLHSDDLLEVLSQLNHPISALGTMQGDGDIAVIATEVWIIKHMGHELWNKRK